MKVVTEVDAIDVAVLIGTFRVTHRPEERGAGLHHGGRRLSVLRRIHGEWRMWRDMDMPPPDADVYYGRLALSL